MTTTTRPARRSCPGPALLAFLTIAGCGGGDGAAADAGPGGGGDGALPVADAYVPGSCDAPPTFADGLSPTRTLHVVAGAAAGGDGSLAAPFATLEQAAAVASPGTAIRLGAGVHAGGAFLADLRGTAAAPIWIGGEPEVTPRPVIEGGGNAIQLQRPAYVVVHDLEVRGQTSNGLNIDDGGAFADPTAAQFVALLRLHVHDVGAGGNQDCVKVSGVSDLFLYDSLIERCGGGGSGIDHVGCHRSVVARNVFRATPGNAVQAKGGSTDVDVRQNRFLDGGTRAVNLGGSTDLTLFRPPLSTVAGNAEARRVRVFDNVVIVAGTSNTPFAFVGCVDCLVAHNLVGGTPRWAVRVLQETSSQGGFTFEPSGQGRVIGNTFVFSSTTLATAVNVGAGTAADTFEFRTNAWLAEDAPARSTPDLPVTETGAIIGQPTGYAALLADPTGNHPLPAGSAEAGAAAAVAEVTGTLTGACRGAARSIGPLEP
ncbi:MAG: right-handed parallel beta-helix repeat-containing protein [Kofleriaceae bacterium]|nr:right-handed parallel beta-helix repeat-containing protein [Kofleriaceae bacterium]